MAELMNCPFCGERAILSRNKTHATCAPCEFLPWLTIAEWNRRASPAIPATPVQGDERARFEKWFASWSDPNIGCVETATRKRAAEQAWLTRATIAAVEAGETAAQGDELPPLPFGIYGRATLEWLTYFTDDQMREYRAARTSPEGE